MGLKLKSVTVRLDEAQLEAVDGLVGHLGFKYRSDVIRKAIKSFLENNKVVGMERE